LRHQPREVFAGGFAAALVDFSAKFLKSKQFKHAGTKGTERESGVRNFFAEYLPQTFAIMSGEAVDMYETRSPQMDVMIYDKLRNFPIISGESVILPIEALLVSVEVKSVLTREGFKQSLAAAKALKSLLPFNRQVVLVRREGEPAGRATRLFHCLFAYSSDLTADEWCAAEYQRWVELTNDSDFTGHEIDRIYVANRGLLHPENAYGIAEMPQAGNALMTFYMHMLNFLQHENGRRAAVPYLHYAGKSIKGIRRLPKAGNKTLEGVELPRRRY
jgi:hypothetical protein